MAESPPLGSGTDSGNIRICRFQESEHQSIFAVEGEMVVGPDFRELYLKYF